MKLCMISFTENGRKLAGKIAEGLDGMEVSVFFKCAHGSQAEYADLFVQSPVQEWAREQMEEGNALLFIGACGIAVRAVAPSLKGKLRDSPVLVMDESGRYVIPILSGHVGGANELACCLAKKTGAEPVITTATDRNGKFAVDLFAKKNGLFITNKEGIAKVSAKALAEKDIAISIETGHWKQGESLPKGVHAVPYPPLCPVEALVTSQKALPPGTRFDLLLRPKEYVIGIGCKKGTKAEEIERFLLRKMEEAGISITQVFALASISQKQREQGILSWCQKERIPFLTYTAEELRGVKGEFPASAFVEQAVGVGNVCERAAIKACGKGGEILLGKCAEGGITAAVAKRRWEVEIAVGGFL